MPLSHSVYCRNCNSTRVCQCEDAYSKHRHGCWQEKWYGSKMREALESEDPDVIFPTPNPIGKAAKTGTINCEKHGIQRSKDAECTCKIFRSEPAIIIPGSLTHDDDCCCWKCKEAFRLELINKGIIQ